MYLLIIIKRNDGLLRPFLAVLILFQKLSNELFSLYVYCVYIYLRLVEIRDFRGSYLFIFFLIIPPETTFK